MNEENSQLLDEDCSCLHIKIHIEQTWINRFLTEQQLVIPVTEQQSLHEADIRLEDGRLMLKANLKEKEGSALQLTCQPVWNIQTQQLELEELDIKMLTNNILLKGAGWIANIFLGAKIDKKIETAISELQAKHMAEILSEGIRIPLPDTGSMAAEVKSILVQEVVFGDQEIIVTAEIEGRWTLVLQ